MEKTQERIRAIELRRQGLSYREIRRQVPVARSTLSLWLRSVGLSKPQQQRITEKRLAAARRGWEKLRAARLERLHRITEAALREATERVANGDLLWAIGTALYWAEGSKVRQDARSQLVTFTNMDPRMLRLIRRWFVISCHVPEGDIRYDIYIHETGDVERARRFWAEQLGLPGDRFQLYFKKSPPSTSRKNTGANYHGTIRLRVRRSSGLNHRIAAWVAGLTPCWGVV